MNDDERERLSVQLCKMWPRKFQDSELTDWCARMDRYRIGDVLHALDEHRNASKFKPQPSEILGRLKGKEVARVQPSEQHDDFATVQRKANPAWEQTTDAEVTLRFWRQMWARFSGDIVTRKGKFAEKSPVQATLDAALAGYERHCRVGCVNTLADYMPHDVATRTAEWIFASPDQFRLALAEVRQTNDQGEVVDAFAA